MIPSDLLRYKIDYKNNKIFPILCSLDNKNTDYQISKKIIEIFDECYNKKYNKEILNYMIKLLEQSEKDYKLVRGLYSILEKKCVFNSVFVNEKNIDSQNFNIPKETIKELTPMSIRRMIFDESALNNIAITEDKRKEILKRVSDKLETNIETTIKLMWSDLEENTIINGYNSLEPLTLLSLYNLSLIQTLLFNCLKMDIRINSNKSIGSLWKEILREIKRLGLMYWLEIDPNGSNDIICTVEGALNIIKLTEKYGNSIAKLVPLILKANNWSIKADILRVTSSGNRTIYNFEITEQSHSDKISSNTIKKIEDESQPIDDENKNNTISYDSNIEKIFAKKFELFNTGWKIDREPEPLITKFRTAFISDFILTKHENKILVEIIGFWTREYLERKIQKISQIIENYDNDNFYLILIINSENLAMYETNQDYSFSNIKNRSNVLIISYKNENISFKEIIPFLKTIERKYIDKNFEKKIDKNNVLLSIEEIFKEFNKSVNTKISLEDLNETLKLSQEKLYTNFDLKEILENNFEFKSVVEKKLRLKELIMVKDTIFKETFIREICGGLKEYRKIKNLKDVCDFLSSKKISEKIHIDLLIFMGFKIDWNGLDYSESKISYIH
ncbi:MAG: DUF790 family protein [Nitrosopumilus sp.]|nr:DUF790 family protein [Nitrosopumilus sp.]